MANRLERAQMQAATLSAVLAALKPVVSILLDAGIHTNEATRLIRWACVSEAASRQRRQRKKPSISRIAAATGLSRPEVSQLLSTPSPSAGLSDLAPRASDKVIAAWLNDPEYLEATGKPKALHYSESSHSFSDLVRRYAGDIPPRAMLAEMVESKVVHETAQGTYAPTMPPGQAFGPKSDAIAEFGAKMNALGSTLARKLHGSDSLRLFDSFVQVGGIRDSDCARVTKELTRRCRTFTQSVERYLLDQASAGSAAPDGQPQQTLGVVVAVAERNLAD